MTESKDCRRKFNRYPTEALVWWSKDWEAEPIALLDISPGGMLCEFPSPLAVDAHINLHFEFPNHEGMIFCRSKVAHCRAGESTYYLVGLEIVELEGMSQVEFVERVKEGVLRKREP